MTIFVRDIISTMPACMEEIIMSVLTAIFQAIFQAICWIFPISESGHSALFHDFAARDSGACSALTGIVHIGIAIGIIVSMYSLFFGLLKEFIATFSDIFKKRLGTNTNPRRSFMYMTLISFAPMVLWAIPTGNGLMYTLLRSTGHNSSVFDEGIFFIITGVLVLLSARALKLASNNKNITWLMALIVGLVNVLLVPIAGLSSIAGVFAILMLFGVTKKLAFRYAFVLSMPVLVVSGIVEICKAVTPAGIVQIIISLVLSVVVSFLSVRVIKWIMDKQYYGYFGIYDIAIGIITAVIGMFELIIK